MEIFSWDCGFIRIIARPYLKRTGSNTAKNLRTAVYWNIRVSILFLVKEKQMQTDAWLTETSHPDCCPLCSQPLSGDSNTCPSCGFTAHESARGRASSARPASASQPRPITPIPARASALRVRNSFPGTPTAFSQPRDGGWQHSSPSYEAASSLSSLSLIIAETPTAPPRTNRQQSRSTRRLEHIDEIDTVPPPARAAIPETPVPAEPISLRLDESEAPDLASMLSEGQAPLPIDEIDTAPDIQRELSRESRPLRSRSREIPVDAASWSASSDVEMSLATRFMTSRPPRRRRRERRFNLVDRVRWWLLRPGRIEFLLWVSGSLLLFGITLLLLLATVFSAMPGGSRAGGNLLSSTATTSTTPVTVTATGSPAMHLTLTSQSPLMPGAELSLRGQGFRPHSQVVFLLDGRWPLLDQRGKPASIQADDAGRFTVTLWLGQGAAWTAGHHQILAREVGSSFQTFMPITITTSSGVNLPGPGANQPPVQQTPTSRPPTPTPSSPTPTPGITPTPSPVMTVTPTRPAGNSTPAPGQTVAPPDLSNALNNHDDGLPFAHLTQVNPLIWLIGTCYLLSMLFLGLAGIMRRRR